VHNRGMDVSRTANELRPALARLEEILRKTEALSEDNEELRMVGDMLQPTVVALSRAINESEGLPDLRKVAQAVGPAARVFSSQKLATLAREAAHVEKVLLEVADRVQPAPSASSATPASTIAQPPSQDAQDDTAEVTEIRERVQAKVRLFSWAHMIGATILAVSVLRQFLSVGWLLGFVVALIVGALLGQLVTVLHGEAALRRSSDTESTRRSGSLMLYFVVVPFSVACVAAAVLLLVRAFPSRTATIEQPSPMPTAITRPSPSPPEVVESRPPTVDRSQLSNELNLLIDEISEARRALEVGDLAAARKHIDIAARYDRDHPLVLESALRLLERTKEDAILAANEGFRAQAVAKLEDAHELAVRFGFAVDEIDELIARIQRQTLHREVAPDDTAGLEMLIGREVTVISRGASRRTGRLVEVTPDHLALETADTIGGGTIDYTLDIPRAGIVTVRYRID